MSCLTVFSCSSITVSHAVKLPHRTNGISIHASPNSQSNLATHSPNTPIPKQNQTPPLRPPPLPSTASSAASPPYSTSPSSSTTPPPPTPPTCYPSAHTPPSFLPQNHPPFQRRHRQHPTIPRPQLHNNRIHQLLQLRNLKTLIPILLIR